MLSLGLLALLLLTIAAQGYTAFVQTTIRLPIELSADAIDPEGTSDPKVLSKANYAKLINESLYQQFPDVTERREKKSTPCFGQSREQPSISERWCWPIPT